MSGPPPTPDDPELAESPEIARRLIWALGGLLVIGLVLVAVTVLGDGGGSTTSTTATTPSTTLVAGETTTTPVSSTSTTVASTTTAASTTTSSTGTTLADPLAALVLGAQGMGSLDFGVEADRVIADLDEILGPSDDDSDWVDSFSAFGTCPGTEARLVRWASLQTFFTNGETDWAPEGIRHFFHYSQSVAAGDGDVLTLATDKGIRLGASVADLRNAYGSDVTFTDDPLFDLLWEVASDGDGILWGSASSAEDDGLVTVINGGFGCGE